MRGVTADLVGGHEEAGDDAEGPEGEEGGGEGDLLDGGAARAPYGPADEVVLVGDGEGVVHVGHAGPGLARVSRGGFACGSSSQVGGGLVRGGRCSAGERGEKRDRLGGSLAEADLDWIGRERRVNPL